MSSQIAGSIRDVECREFTSLAKEVNARLEALSNNPEVVCYMTEMKMFRVSRHDPRTRSSSSMCEGLPVQQ